MNYFLGQGLRHETACSRVPDLISLVIPKLARRARVVQGVIEKSGTVGVAATTDLNNPPRSLIYEKVSPGGTGLNQGIAAFKFLLPVEGVIAAAVSHPDSCPISETVTLNAEALASGLANDLLVGPVRAAEVPHLALCPAALELRHVAVKKPAIAHAVQAVRIGEIEVRGRVSRGRLDYGRHGEPEQTRCRYRQGRPPPSASECTTDRARAFYAESHIFLSSPSDRV